MHVSKLTLALVLPALALGSLGAEVLAQDKVLPACGMGAQVLDFLRYPAVIVGVDKAKGSYNLRRENGSTYWAPAQDLRLACKHEPQEGARTAATFVGTWDVFVPSAFTRSSRDPEKAVLGPGGKGGTVTVRADGGYTWIFGDKPITGQWRELAPADVKRGAKPPAIVLTGAYSGADWQMSTDGRVTHDNRESFSLDQLPGGVSMMVTRR